MADYRHIIDLLPSTHQKYDTWVLNDIFNNIIEKSRLHPHEIDRAKQLRQDLGYPKLSTWGTK